MSANVMAADEQALSVDAIVQLITIDAAALGGGIARIAAGPRDGAALAFKGLSYRPLPVRLRDVRLGARGGEPVLEAARDDAALVALMAATGDLVGAAVKRIKTFAKYLDGAAAADAAKHWPEEQWTIRSLLKRDAATVSWRLASALVLDGERLPRRQAMRDVCPWAYRRRVNNAWEYTAAADGGCPYRGNSYFTAADAATSSAAADDCSRRIDGCRARYPGAAVLPFGGFAGLGRAVR